MPSHERFMIGEDTAVQSASSRSSSNKVFKSQIEDDLILFIKVIEEEVLSTLW
jgi:hypothetical protein